MQTKLLFTTLVFLMAVTAFGGMVYWMNCETPACQYKSRIKFRGGTVYEQVSGYCTTCKEFVSLEWRRPNLTEEGKGIAASSNLSDKPPAILGSVWNPATGTFTALYPCPKCKSAFIEITLQSLLKGRSEESGQLCCPHCTNETVRLTGPGFND